MSAEMAQYICERLQKEFNRKFTLSGLDLVKDELVAASDKALEKTFDYFVLNNRFPSPEQLRERVQFEVKLTLAAEARERESEWYKQKGGETRGELEKQPTIFSSHQATAHGKKALTLLKLTVNKEIPRKVIINELREMDRAYPGLGYGSVADEFQRDWEV